MCNSFQNQKDDIFFSQSFNKFLARISIRQGVLTRSVSENFNNFKNVVFSLRESALGYWASGGGDTIVAYGQGVWEHVGGSSKHCHVPFSAQVYWIERPNLTLEVGMMQHVSSNLPHSHLHCIMVLRNPSSGVQNAERGIRLCVLSHCCVWVKLH